MKNQMSIKGSFNIIQWVAALLVVFLVVQGLILWRVSDSGWRAIAKLEK